MKTAVLLIAFARPETTRQVFEQIRRAKPPRLYVAADGPRPGHNEETRCEEVRQLVTQVDWDCELKTLFRTENKGLRIGIPEAITWFLEVEGEGIILEDDTLPTPEFFPFCEELLDRYRDDPRVSAIGGTNFNYPIGLPEYSYFYTRQMLIWGWATWKRAWDKRGTYRRHRDEIFRDPGVFDMLYTDEFENIVKRKNLFDAEAGRVSSWAYEFQTDSLLHGAYCIAPTQNLVTNVGFGAGSTNTADADSYFANLKLETMQFPLQHPEYFVQSKSFQDHLFYPNQRRDELMSYREFAKLLWNKTIKRLKGQKSITLPE